MNNELYHWKYIKREKKNGKWVYTYDNGTSSKKNYQQAKKNLDTRNAQERSAYARNLSSGGVKNVAFNNYTHYQYGDKGVRDKLESQYKSAKSEYEKSPIGKKEQRSENLKRGVEKVKNWAKDVAGYDEKQAMESAKVNAKVKGYKANDVDRENREWKQKHPDDDSIEYLADWQTNYYRKIADAAEAKMRKAIRKYEKTPLAKIENMKGSINSAKEWVNSLFKTKGAPTPKLSPPNPKIITENVITENVIKEETIPEKYIYEETIPEKYIYEKRLGNKKRT